MENIDILELRLQQQITQYLHDFLYSKLIDKVKDIYKKHKQKPPTFKMNSPDPVADAFANEKIYFYDGVIQGELDDNIKNILRGLGAEYDNQKKGYRISIENLSGQTQATLKEITDFNKILYKEINQYLQSITLKDILLKDNVAFNNIYLQSIQQLDKNLLKKYPRLSKAEVLDKKQRIDMSIKYSQDLTKPIKNLADNAITQIRKDIANLTLQENGKYNLTKILQERAGVSQSKASFIAKQELSLLNTAITTEKYKQSGVYYYIWRTSRDQRVREDHKHLNGNIYSYDDNPPITTHTTKQRNLPGEDYGCRCIASPILGSKDDFVPGGTDKLGNAIYKKKNNNSNIN